MDRLRDQLDTDTDDQPGPSGQRFSGLLAHAATWGFAFLMLRIFAVSGYHWDTAFAVSTTLGVDDGLPLLFGSLFAGHLLTEVMLSGVLPLLVAAFLWGPREHRPGVLLLVTLSLAALVALTLSFGSWWLPLAASLVFGVVALVRRLPSGNWLRNATTAAIARVGWVAAVAVLFVAAFVPTPWVPHEKIQTTSGTLSGYVLSVDSGYLNVLTDDHEFVIVLSSEVRSRR